MSSISSSPYYTSALWTTTGLETQVEDCIARLELHIFLGLHHYFLHLKWHISALQKQTNLLSMLFGPTQQTHIKY